MLLITTAIEETFDNNKKCLFLGEWCKKYSRREHWSKFTSVTMTYPWGDLALKEKHSNDIQCHYTKVLPQITQYLNELHGLEENVKYWELIVGAWLQMFIAVVYERYICLKRADESYDIEYSYIERKTNKIQPALDFQDFCSNKVVDDVWNFCLYSQIIEKTKLIKYRNIDVLNIENEVSVQIKPKRKNMIRSKIKSVAAEIFSMFHHERNSIYFSNSYFSMPSLLKIQFKLGQIPSLLSPQLNVANTFVNVQQRKSFSFDSQNDFHSLLLQLLHSHLPKAYVESFSDLRIRAIQKFPRNVKVINTAIGDMADEAFKIWTAEQIKTGAYLTINQHGGCYGLSKLTQAEVFQCRVANRFYSWGWKDANNSKIIPLPAVKLHSQLKASKDNCSILIVLFNQPRYSYWSQSFPIAEQMQEYIEDQLDFVSKLDDTSLNQLKIRYYPKDFGWCIEERFADKGYAQYKDNSKNLKAAISKCSICISTYNATTFLETLSSNIPTLMYWRPEHFDIRESAKPFFNELMAVGILHYSTSEAANFVNQIHKSPLKWWLQYDVQLARRHFCDQYALTDENWVDSWFSELATLRAL